MSKAIVRLVGVQSEEGILEMQRLHSFTPLIIPKNHFNRFNHTQSICCCFACFFYLPIRRLESLSMSLKFKPWTRLYDCHSLSPSSLHFFASMVSQTMKFLIQPWSPCLGPLVCSPCIFDSLCKFCKFVFLVQLRGRCQLLRSLP